MSNSSGVKTCEKIWEAGGESGPNGSKWGPKLGFLSFFKVCWNYIG